MKVLIALLPLLAGCFAGEVPYSKEAQRGLLVLPKQEPTNSTSTTPKPQYAQRGLLVLPKQGPTNATSTTPKPQYDNRENLDNVNAKIMERLRQEQGSQRGVYHVYLQDGRLQRVQYTTAPITPGQQQQDASSSYNQQQQTPEILSSENAERRGVYFVQVPQERIQALQARSQQALQQNSQYSQAYAPAQYNQQPANQIDVRYLPLEASPIQNQFAASGYSQPAGYNSQYRQQQQQGESTDYSSQYRQQQGEPTGYLASVQYSEVEPIQGPVYSYKPEPLTRILRYAPVF